MNTSAKAVFALIIFTVVPIYAAVKLSSKTVAIESPDDISLLRQPHAEAMYLLDTNSGRTVLYIEQAEGKGLAALDVTDPGQIREIAEIKLSASSAFDFIHAINHDNVLIKYKDDSGSAILNFKHYQQPQFIALNQVQDIDEIEHLGMSTMLIREGGNANTHVADPRSYTLLDSSNPINPILLAKLTGVKEQLTKDDTGTRFLLNDKGITVIRDLTKEQERRIGRNAQSGN